MQKFSHVKRKDSSSLKILRKRLIAAAKIYDS